MSTQLSLPSCSSPVLRKIARYLAPNIVSRYDLNSYVNLQRCCNPAFADEVRSIMKISLHIAQAAIAFHSAQYVLQYPQVCHNPHYLPLVTFAHVCALFEKLNDNGTTMRGTGFSKLFMKALMRADDGPRLPIVQTIRHKISIGRKLDAHIAEHNFEQDNYQPFLGVSLFEDGILHPYDYALVRQATGSEFKVVLLGRSNGDFVFIYIQGPISQWWPFPYQ